MRIQNLTRALIVPKAQPYPLIIESDPVTIVMTWDPAKSGIIGFESDW